MLRRLLLGCVTGMAMVVPALAEGLPDAAIAAILKARETLPAFIALVQKPTPGASRFSLRVAVAGTAGIEFVWLKPLAFRGDAVLGEIESDPLGQESLKRGDKVAVALSEVVDWTYLDETRMVGNFTGCVLAAEMGLRERAAFDRETGLRCER